MTVKIDRRAPGTQPQGVVDGYPQTALRWPSQPLHKRPPTASELSGPRLGPGGLLRRLAPVRGDLAGVGAKRPIGQLLHLRARVVDEDGAPRGGFTSPRAARPAPAGPEDRPGVRVRAGGARAHRDAGPAVKRLSAVKPLP